MGAQQPVLLSESHTISVVVEQSTSVNLVNVNTGITQLGRYHY
jgi:hypothetical protein